MRRLLTASVLLAAACATVPAESGPPEQGGDGAAVCSTASLADLVGRAASQELGAEALRRSGARRLRWIRPGDAVTMDYSPQRLNIRLDGRNRVESFDCG